MSDQKGLDLETGQKNAGPVECLGLTFESDAARREYFLAQLAEKLKDPEFRSTPGFPLGSDDDILQLSDPPYYTACPNPFFAELLDHWNRQAAESPGPYETVVPIDSLRPGTKTEPAYTLHTYHSKIPPAVLKQLIAHYSTPGDVVLDPFCGSGTAGVAVAELNSTEDRARLPILIDLSPAAAFITSCLTLPVSAGDLQSAGDQVLSRLMPRLDQAYSDAEGRFDYTLNSDVFICDACGAASSFWEAAVDRDALRFEESPQCPSCGAEFSKSNRAMVTLLDPVLGEQVTIAEQVAVARRRKKKLEILQSAPE